MFPFFYQEVTLIKNSINQARVHIILSTLIIDCLFNVHPESNNSLLFVKYLLN